MAKRIQISLSEVEYLALAEAARMQGKPVATVVRESIRHMIAEGPDEGPEKRIAAVLHFAGFDDPTADIEQVLDEIERGRGPT